MLTSEVDFTRFKSGPKASKLYEFMEAYCLLDKAITMDPPCSETFKKIIYLIFVSKQIECPKRFKLLILKHVSEVILSEEFMLSNEVISALVAEWSMIELSLKHEAVKYFTEVKWACNEDVYEKIRFALTEAANISFMLGL